MESHRICTSQKLDCLNQPIAKVMELLWIGSPNSPEGSFSTHGGLRRVHYKASASTGIEESISINTAVNTPD